jgi:hypothetical protein
MPLIIVDATEHDIPEMMRIDNEAYSTSVGSNIPCPNGRSAEALKAQGEDVVKLAREDPTVQNLKVFDTDNGDTPIAFARWYIYCRDTRSTSSQIRAANFEELFATDFDLKQFGRESVQNLLPGQTSHKA